MELHFCETFEKITQIFLVITLLLLLYLMDMLHQLRTQLNEKDLERSLKRQTDLCLYETFSRKAKEWF